MGNPQLVIVSITPNNSNLIIHDIDNTQVTIGRKMSSSICDVEIPHQIVSSVHGIVKKEGSGYVYHDQNSTNGSYSSFQNHMPAKKQTIFLTKYMRVCFGKPQKNNGVYMYFFEDNEYAWDLRTLAAGEMISVGRTRENTFYMNSSRISRKHFVVQNVGGRLIVKDENSTNGTVVNGQKIHGAVELKDGDIISISHIKVINVAGHLLCGMRLAGEMQKPVMQDGVKRTGDAKTPGFHVENNSDKNGFRESNPDEDYIWDEISIAGKDKIYIGRSHENDITIPQLTVSRRHVAIINNGNYYSVRDLKSHNGTLLNNCILRGEVQLNYGDTIKVGSAKIRFLNSTISYGIPIAAALEEKNRIKTHEQVVHDRLDQMMLQEPEANSYTYSFKSGMKVELKKVSRIVPCKRGTGINGGNKKYILKDISLKIAPGQLVAILGGSGAGKTTFMNCINGFEPATSGEVRVNDSDLYKNYSVLKNRIGYVPQQDIIHDELTLQTMLKYVAKLRLPADLSREEIATKIDEVMAMVDLTEHRHTVIKKMSGGQRKRASIAVELLSDPELFFLDEPTSGLDPEAETNLMKQLRNLASHKGKTVIVITHTLQNIHLFDKIIFLAPGGRLCFYGSPKDGLTFFETDNLSNAYEKISADVNGYVSRYERSRGGLTTHG